MHILTHVNHKDQTSPWYVPAPGITPQKSPLEDPFSQYLDTLVDGTPSNTALVETLTPPAPSSSPDPPLGDGEAPLKKHRASLESPTTPVSPTPLPNDVDEKIAILESYLNDYGGVCALHGLSSSLPLLNPHTDLHTSDLINTNFYLRQYCKTIHCYINKPILCSSCGGCKRFKHPVWACDNDLLQDFWLGIPYLVFTIPVITQIVFNFLGMHYTGEIMDSIHLFGTWLLSSCNTGSGCSHHVLATTLGTPAQTENPAIRPQYIMSQDFATHTQTFICSDHRFILCNLRTFGLYLEIPSRCTYMLPHPQSSLAILPSSMSSMQPSSVIPWRPNLLAIQGVPSLLAPLLPAPPPPTPPLCSFPKDRNYFYLKEVDWILFLAMQTVCPFPSQIKPDFTHDDPDIDTIFQLRSNLSRHIQVAATPNNSELKYTGPLFQCLATIQIVGSGTSHTLSPGQKASWKWLEDTLHHTASIFSIDCLLPLEFSMLPLPSSYSYLCVRKKQSHAVRHALLQYKTANYADPQHPLSPSRTLIQSGLSETRICDILNVLQPEVLGRCIGVVLDPQSSALGILYPYLNYIHVPAWVKKTLQAALDFIIPTQRDGMRFFVWDHSKQGRFHREHDLEDAKKDLKTRCQAEFAYDKISNQWDICSLFDKDRDLLHDDAQFDQPLQEILAMPAPLLSNPPTLPSNHNKLGRIVVHQTTTGQDMLYSTYLEDILYSHCRLLCSTQDEI
ncbi:hypothetical protein F4604DRAFT_1680587 [Suillus subluteus]|nr:hypothetical protein F4604DRAFT_1680587 [Suillus subluteus]